MRDERRENSNCRRLPRAEGEEREEHSPAQQKQRRATVLLLHTGKCLNAVSSRDILRHREKIGQESDT